MDSLVRVTDEERTVKELKLSDKFLKACQKRSEKVRVICSMNQRPLRSITRNGSYLLLKIFSLIRNKVKMKLHRYS